MQVSLTFRLLWNLTTAVIDWADWADSRTLAAETGKPLEGLLAGLVRRSIQQGHSDDVGNPLYEVMNSMVESVRH